MMTSIGSIAIAARTRGTIRYCTGSVPSEVKASICSVTRIVPSSAAMALPTRPVTMRAVSTGESSRVKESATTLPTKFSAWNRAKPLYVWSAMTMPVKRVVRNTTGIESTPTRTICRRSSRMS